MVEKVGTLHSLTFRSKCLRGNPMGNSTLRPLPVYTPPGWRKGDRLPCLFYLPGFGGGAEKWMKKDFPAWRMMDLLILSGAVPPAVLVCVDGMTRLGGSQYVDSDLNGPFLTHILKEIVPEVEKRFSVEGPYGVFGHSSGGFAALNTASLYPDVFHSAVSFGGDTHFEITHKNYLAELVSDLMSGALPGSLKEVLKAENTHYALGLAAAYSPNLRKKQWMMDLPIDIKTGEINEKIWKKWLSYDPIEWVGERKNALKKLKKITLICGGQDQHGLHVGAVTFAERCSKHKIKAEVRINPEGDHSLLLSQLEQGIRELL